MSAPESGIAVIVYNSRWLKEGKEATTRKSILVPKNITNWKKKKGGMNKPKKQLQLIVEKN